MSSPIFLGKKKKKKKKKNDITDFSSDNSVEHWFHKKKMLSL